MNYTKLHQIKQFMGTKQSMQVHVCACISLWLYWLWFWAVWINQLILHASNAQPIKFNYSSNDPSDTLRNGMLLMSWELVLRRLAVLIGNGTIIVLWICQTLLTVSLMIAATLYRCTEREHGMISLLKIFMVFAVKEMFCSLAVIRNIVWIHIFCNIMMDFTV